MGMMSCCRALTKCKYRQPLGQLWSNFPRGIYFTAAGASAAVLQHVIPLQVSTETAYPAIWARSIP